MTPPRPRVRLHFGQSVDGKIYAPGLGARALGGPVDARAMQHARAWADAVLVGAGTLRSADVPMRLRRAELVAARVARGQHPQPLPVVLSRGGNLPAAARMFREAAADGVRPLVVVGPTAALGNVTAALGAVADVVAPRCPCDDPQHPEDDVCVPSLLGRLAAQGVRRLLVEGGGEVAFAFAAARRLDEVWCTVAPCLLGGARAPTPVGGAGLSFGGRLRLRLRRVSVCGDVLLLRYRAVGCFHRSASRSSPPHRRQIPR